MSDPRGNHYCKRAITEDNGECFCCEVDQWVSCRGVVEECDLEDKIQELKEVHEQIQKVTLERGL